MTYLMENISDILVGIIIAVSIFFVIKSQFGGKKKSTCAGGCSNCSGGDSSKSVHLKTDISEGGISCDVHGNAPCAGHGGAKCEMSREVNCGIHPVDITYCDSTEKSKD